MSISSEEKLSLAENSNKFLEEAKEYDTELEDVQKEEVGKETKKWNKKGLLLDLILYGIILVVCIYILPNYILQRTIVDGTSMENTLHNGDHLFVEKITHHFKGYERFDVVVFYPYGREYEDYYVKRIIGLPGEKVQIIGSDIYINGEILEENYGKDPIYEAGRAAEPITLGEDEFFVLGDNRSNSKDSRMDEVGNVKYKDIAGQAVLRIKPLKDFGFIK